MNKNILGPWGADLSDDDYACALAALGVLESTDLTPEHPSDRDELAATIAKALELGEQTLAWRRTKDPAARTTLAAWQETIYRDPGALAAAWRQFAHSMHHERMMPRVAVPKAWCDYPHIVDIDDLCLWLERAYRLNAVVVAERQPGPQRVPWHWPLRVGVLNDADQAPILDALRAAQRPNSWVERLARCYTVGSSRDACDLLIVSPRAAFEVRKLPRRVRASFVVLLDEPREPSFPDGRYGDLLGTSRAAGVAAVGPLHLSPQRLSDWFVSVLRQISHDVPIHAAVWSVSRQGPSRNTLVTGYPAALDTCRILAIADRHDRVVASMTTLDTSERSPRGELTFGGPEPPTMRGRSTSVKPNFADELRHRMFTSEVVDGEATARDFERRDQELGAARVPRWIQANAWRGDATGPAGALAPRAWNAMAVHIGPSTVVRRDVAFPDAKLDFTRGDVVASVQLELAGATVKKIVASGDDAIAVLASAAGPGLPPEADDDDVTGIDSSEVVLPPAGDSTRAWFLVCPHAAGRLTGRISIIHNNRVLQTARLEVDVNAAAQSGAGIDVRSEASIHSPDEDLTERRSYDVAIQVSDVGGTLHMTIERDGQPVTVRLDNLTSAISRISDGLEYIAKKRDFSKPLTAQPAFDDTLYTLAAAGSELQQHLRKKCGDAIDQWERIHLVPSTNQFLPLEYVYDGRPPKVGATACPNMQGALDRGSCERAVGPDGNEAPCPNRNEKSFTCPMHFWGFRKLIERNGTVDGGPPVTSGAGSAGAIQRLCVPAKQPYGKVKGLAFAASNRAFLYATDPASQAAERDGVITALQALCGTVLKPSDWDEWRQTVEAHPNLLVLIAHTDEFKSSPVLEIGDRQLLGRQEIDEEVSGAGGNPQLLILLGCSAADVAENFQPYPERFRDAGVSIVLAPVAPIRGADAVPIAKGLARLLANTMAQRDQTAFGELLPLLRRRLLRDGHAGVMSIVGFGDGDWLIGG